MELLSVPFHNVSYTESASAQIRVRGVLRTEADGLVLEYRRSVRDLGTTKLKEGEIRTVHVPWAEVQSLTFRRRLLLGNALVLRTRSLRALEGVPLADGNELSLSVARGDRLAARELAANVELALAEHRLAALHASPPRSTLPPA
jgi:hypothetical protein